jgi:hypothetical protein
VVPGSQEAEAGGYIEPRSSGPAWATFWDPVSKISKYKNEEEKTNF